MSAWSSIEADDLGVIFITTRTNGVPHRRPIEPGEDVSGEPAIIQAAAADIWTSEVIDAAEARRKARAEAEESRAKQAAVAEAARLAESEALAKAAAEARRKEIDDAVAAALAKSGAVALAQAVRG